MQMTFGKHEGVEIGSLTTEYLSWAVAQFWFRGRYPEHYREARRHLVHRLIEEMPISDIECVLNRVDSYHKRFEDLV